MVLVSIFNHKKWKWRTEINKSFFPKCVTKRGLLLVVITGLYFFYKLILRILNQCNVVTLKEKTTTSSTSSRLGIDFIGVIQYKIHIFIKSTNDPFHPQANVFVQPDHYPRLVLEVPKNQVNGLNHNLLDLLLPLVERHDGVWVWSWSLTGKQLIN